MNQDWQEFPDELISAYLDDELSPQEKQRVEEQLMDSPEHRRQFEELNALRRNLQSLPQQALDDDFAQRVMRRAERQLLVGSQPNLDSAAPAPATAVRPADATGAWRGLVWSALALAAAIALVMFGPPLGEGRRQDVAERPAANSTEEHFIVRSEKQIANSHATEPKTAASRRAVPGGAADNAVRANAASEADKSTAQLAANSREATERIRDDRAAPAGEFSQAGRVESVPFDGLTIRPAAPAMPHTGDELPPAVLPAAPAPKPAPANSVAALERARQNELRLSDDRQKLSAFADRGAAMASGAPPSGLARSGFVASDNLAPAAETANGMTVVSLDITTAALESNFFDEQLRKHQIEVVEPADAGSGHRFARREAIGAKQELQQGGQPLAENRSLRRSTEGDVELIYVVANPSQIQELLASLGQQPSEVVAIAYNHPPSARALWKSREDAIAKLDIKSATGPALGRDVSSDAALGDGLPNELKYANSPQATASHVADALHAKDRTVKSDSDAVVDAFGQGQAAAGGGAAAATKLQLDGQLAQSGANPIRKRGQERLDKDNKEAEQAEFAGHDLQRRAIVESQSYRGIARRLHLPEDLGALVEQAKSGQPEPQPMPLADVASEGNVPADPTKVVAANEAQPVVVAASPAAIGGPPADAAPSGKPADGSLAAEAKKQLHRTAADALGEEKLAAEKPVRVLFVLRAAPQVAPHAASRDVEAELAPAATAPADAQE